jgi:hypothetical protein
MRCRGNWLCGYSGEALYSTIQGYGRYDTVIDGPGMEMVLKVIHDKESNRAPAAPGRLARACIAFNQVGLQNCAKLVRQSPPVLPSNRASPRVMIFLSSRFAFRARLLPAGLVVGVPPACRSRCLFVKRT